MYESAICCEYLCDANSPTTLMPNDPIERAVIRLLNDHCDNIFTKTQFTFLMNKDERKDEELMRNMEAALLTYEVALVKSGGTYQDHWTFENSKGTDDRDIITMTDIGTDLLPTRIPSSQTRPKAVQKTCARTSMHYVCIYFAYF